MGEKKQRESRNQRLLKENPTCCFCGGATPSSTVDHVPPKACFPAGFFPEGFEFAACASCNASTRKDDQIFAYYSQLADPNWKNKDLKTFLKIQNGVRNNFPGALPNVNLDNEAKKKALKEMGIEPPPDDLLAKVPLAGIPGEFDAAATTVGRKLACALYHRETQKVLSKDHFIWTGVVHLPDPRVEALGKYLENLLPDQVKGARENVKEYGERFGYRSGYKEKEDFFMSAAQFGRGFAVICVTGKRDAGYKLPPGEQHSIFDPPAPEGAVVAEQAVEGAVQAPAQAVAAPEAGQPA